jgi:predicted N-acetyltransferase YhbS/quinol monooxygenase YgiN
MALIQLTGHLICTSAAERQAVLAHLPAHIGATVREPGCLFFDIAQSADPMVWTVSEGFASRTDFDAHQARTAASPWAAATRAIKRVYEMGEATPEITAETATDARAIGLMTQTAFGGPDEAQLIAALRTDGDLALSLVARFGRACLGHVAFSPLTAPVKAWALAPVSVRKPCRHQGIGTDLIRAGIQTARAQGVEALLVLGDPAYYGRFGFSVAAAQGLRTPYDGPHLQALSLSGARLPAGEITYPPAFAAL